MTMTKGAGHNPAIPFYLRAMREHRPPEWVKTPQGDILRQVESRLQTIFVEEHQLNLLDDLVAELERIKTRAQYLVAEERKRLEAPTKNVRVVTSAPAKPELASGPNTGRAGMPVQEQAAEASSQVEAFELMKTAIREYVKTGDITNVVPNGYFTSKEESDLWSHYTMAYINSVNGRTVHATKLSNDKPLNAVVLAQGVTAEKGKCIILQDDNRLIIDVVPLPAASADQLSRTFNALYRR